MKTVITPLRGALALSILALSGCNVVSVDEEQRAATVSKGEVDASAVERPEKPLGPDRHEYESAYGSLQKAVAANDREAASRLVNYPLTVSRGTVHRTIATPAQFITEYDTIITPSVREVIVEHDFDTVVGDRYDRSDDVDLFVAGALLGAVTESVARNWGRRYSVSNNYYYQGYANYYYDGCHGIGCLVDPPPPVNTYDGYTGCHGDGCLVDDPDAELGYQSAQRPFVADGVPEPGQTTFTGGDSDGPPEPGQTSFTGGDSDGPPEPGQTSFTGDDSDGPPGPRQSDDSDDGSDDVPEPEESDDSNASDDGSDDVPEPEELDDSDASDDGSDDVPEPEESDDSDASDDASDDVPEPEPEPEPEPSDDSDDN